MTLNKQLGDWSGLLKPTLDSDYMRKLGLFLNQEYKKRCVYPKKTDIFKAFRACSYHDLKVVIIGMDPYNDSRSTGIAFGNRQEDITVSPSLFKIWETVERNIDEPIKLDFDVTLESWCKQGVLLLNSALTVHKYKPGSHIKYWRKFIAELLIALNKDKSDIIYCLWGNQTKELEQFIDKNNNIVLKATHPAFAVRNNSDWDCNHFSEVNEILKSRGDDEIKW